MAQIADMAVKAGWRCPFCPSPLDWQLGWERIGGVDVVAALAGVPQDPVHHAEGDVLNHTRLVVEALTAQREWRNLGEAARNLVLAAALLHDVGKAAATSIDCSGRVVVTDHARKGAANVREALWLGGPLGEPAPMAVRETISGLVRWHGLPLRLLRRADPVRAASEVSQIVRLDWLALLAEADVRGRACADRAALLDEVELFRQFCQEQRCYGRPRPFPSDHSRVLYFRNHQADPDYEAYDDTRFEVVMMSGLPGAGKDTWLQQSLSGWPVISLDRIRQELAVGPEQNQGIVIQTAKERARRLLREGRSFAWNATNVTRMIRRPLIDLFSNYRARVRVVYVEAPLDEVLRRNQQRVTSVPEKIIHELLGKLEVPNLTEAHRVEIVLTA